MITFSHNSLFNLKKIYIIPDGLYVKVCGHANIHLCSPVLKAIGIKDAGITATAFLILQKLGGMTKSM